MQTFGDFTDEETPGQRAEHHKFGIPRDLMKYPRQHKTAENHRCRDQHGNTADRHQNDTDLQIVETWLDRQEQDRKDVLKDQNTKGNPPGERVEFTLLVKNLDDDDGARKRAGHRKIKRVELAAPQRQADSDKECEAEQTRANQLPACGKKDHLAGSDNLFQIDLEADHEQHEDQAELGDRADRFLRLDPANAERADDEATDQISEDQRLPEKMRGKAKHPGKQDRKGNIAN